MSHLHTQPGQHDTTVSAYIIRLDTAEPVLILHKHKKLHKWLQFGGHVELDENPWDAITHEISEESGYDMHQLKILQPSMRLAKLSNATLHPYPAAVITHQFSNTDHYHTDTAYAFLTHELPAGTIDEGESEDIEMFTATELAAIPSDEIPESVREIGLFILERCLADWIGVNPADFQASSSANDQQVRMVSSA